MKKSSNDLCSAVVTSDTMTLGMMGVEERAILKVHGAAWMTT